LYSYLAHNDEIRREMLADINLKSVEELFSHVNPRIPGLQMPAGVSEAEAFKMLAEMAGKNCGRDKYISFLGGGVYNRYVPACVQAIIERSEFYTSYTPYQPEVSQGTLQAIFDYQTLICNLTGMDVSNASVYDGATACAEAVLMASRIAKKYEILVSCAVNPEYIAVVQTYCYGEDIRVNVADLTENINFDDYSCVLVQNPNYFGRVENIDICRKIAQSQAKLVVCADPVSLALLKSPFDYGADIVVGDFQSLGIAMNFGGPHGGFIACREGYLRQLPGRIVGFTTDKDGREAFTLTLQTREQHIRREKATSNICTNTALTALAATVYLSALGPQGLKEVAGVSVQRAHYFAEKLSEVPGLSIVHNDFLYEFVLKIEHISAADFIKKMAENGIFIGIDMQKADEGMRNCVLVSVTEFNSIEDIDRAVGAAKEACAVPGMSV